MFSEDELQPISALQHLAFCERQWGLIHLEGLWAENRLTAEGQRLHEAANRPESEQRGTVRTARGLHLRSLRLGLVGRADVVEFHLLPGPGDASRPADGGLPLGVRLKDVEGLWRPEPVEYKRGRPKGNRCDEVQLCAQALCVEEMLQVSVPHGALFYGRTRRRHAVAFDGSLREETEALTDRLHRLFGAGATPRAVYGPGCDQCSLVDQCLPKALGGGRSARRYLSSVYGEAVDDGEGE